MVKTKQNASTYNNQMRPDTLSDVFGKEVYTVEGVYLGTVNDVRIDINRNNATGLCLTQVNEGLIQATDENKDNVIIPYNWINSVSDVVMTIDVINRLE